MRSQDDLIARGIEASRIAAGRNIVSEDESDLSEERSRLLELKKDISQLQNHLGLAGPPRFKPVVARVTKRELNAWWQRIYLRKGEEHGIRKGYGVIFSGGVVGRIVETSSRSSVVQLATSPSFRIAAYLKGDKVKQPVTFQGGGSQSFSSPFGHAKDAPNNDEIAPTANSPAQLATSSFSDAFPPDVIIGEIFHLKIDSNGLFRTGRVEMDKRLLTLREVTVLVPQSPRLFQ
ncbi:MAG: rod shape-determining protein MreC [Opitutales bacterium]